MTVTLYQGDCLEILPTLGDGSVYATVTDPPYGGINHIDRYHERAKYANGQIRKLHKGNADVVTFSWDDVLNQIDRITTAWVYVFAGDNTGYVRSYFSSRDCLTRFGVWEKSNPTPLQGQYIWLSSLELCAIARKHHGIFNRFCDSPVWKYPTSRSTEHPTEKPLGLMIEIIESSTSPDQVVIDPFMGSGTTGVACVQLGRSFIGIELDPNYFAIAEKRITEAQLQPQLDLAPIRESTEPTEPEWKQVKIGLAKWLKEQE